MPRRGVVSVMAAAGVNPALRSGPPCRGRACPAAPICTLNLSRGSTRCRSSPRQGEPCPTCCPTVNERRSSNKLQTASGGRVGVDRVRLQSRYPHRVTRRGIGGCGGRGGRRRRRCSRVGGSGGPRRSAVAVEVVLDVEHAEVGAEGRVVPEEVDDEGRGEGPVGGGSVGVVGEEGVGPLEGGEGGEAAGHRVAEGGGDGGVEAMIGEHTAEAGDGGGGGEGVAGRVAGEAAIGSLQAQEPGEEAFSTGPSGRTSILPAAAGRGRGLPPRRRRA